MISDIARYEKWYGIIDGANRPIAIRNNMKEVEGWQKFSCAMTVINGIHSLERYRQLSTAQSSRHSPRFYVEMTLFDELYNLYI